MWEIEMGEHRVAVFDSGNRYKPTKSKCLDCGLAAYNRRDFESRPCPA